MPSVEDHPLRMLRIQVGMSQAQLAEEAEVSRGFIAAIEEGRVKNPKPTILRALSVRAGLPVDQIEERLLRWQQEKPRLSRRAQNTLSLPPYILGEYKSFQQWRSDIAPTITAFASLAKTPRSSVERYEKGQLAKMPSPLIAALYYLGASPEYVSALMEVPNGYDQ